jgi:NAD(P)-dependent dehydrogenase (short-subunit alcohol dehydrogenase family)
MYWQISAPKSPIRDAAKYIRRDFEKIDVLINNAGTWFSELKLTEDG